MNTWGNQSRSFLREKPCAPFLKPRDFIRQAWSEGLRTGARHAALPGGIRGLGGRGSGARGLPFRTDEPVVRATVQNHHSRSEFDLGLKDAGAAGKMLGKHRR